MPWPSASPLPLSLGDPCFHHQDHPSSRVPSFIEEVARVWRAAFLCSNPPPFLVPTPTWRRLKGIVCVGSGSASLSVCGHPLLLSASPPNSQQLALLPQQMGTLSSCGPEVSVGSQPWDTAGHSWLNVALETCLCPSVTNTYLPAGWQETSLLLIWHLEHNPLASQPLANSFTREAGGRSLGGTGR